MRERELPGSGPATVRRLQAACGVLAPSAFVGAWVAGGLLTKDYSPVREAISQLAREGADTAPLMTAGFVAFGLLLPVYAQSLGTRGARAAATVSGIGTLAVAALPLSRIGDQPVDLWHAVAAGTGYLGQGLAPLLAAPAVNGTRARRTCYAVSGLAAGCLIASLALPRYTGLLQRAGLTVVDVWFAVDALRLARRR